MPDRSQQAKIISKNIKDLRENLGWNQSTLANKAGITPAALSQIEKGDKRLPTYVVLRKIASALKVEPYEITGEEAPSHSAAEEKSRDFYRRWDILDDLSQEDQEMLRGMAERLKDLKKND